MEVERKQAPFNMALNTLESIRNWIDNIAKLSHRDVEDSFELINSGLPSGLSQIQQVNINKLGIFNEETWEGQQELLSPPYQSEYIIPIGESWYDTLNSTINYDEQEVNDNNSSGSRVSRLWRYVRFCMAY